MRAIPSSMDTAIVAEVDARLAGVEAEHAVTIPWAIESGSRAWGFPSPDSDYDCRFLYVQSRDAYLSPWPFRDVIETPLDKIFDVNGWDLAKALRLLVKGNATVTEWLRSPIVYSGDVDFRDRVLELATSVYNPVLAGRHYLHVGLMQREKSVERMTLKRVFYALRPAATLLWLRDNPGAGVPPMDLATLLEQSSPSAAVVERVTELVALKSVTREVGRGEVPPVILDFIATELEIAHTLYSDADPTGTPDARAQCEAFFLEWVG
jgi:predicted nucleotidyltransferase